MGGTPSKAHKLPGRKHSHFALSTDAVASLDDELAQDHALGVLARLPVEVLVLMGERLDLLNVAQLSCCSRYLFVLLADDLLWSESRTRFHLRTNVPSTEACCNKGRFLKAYSTLDERGERLRALHARKLAQEAAARSVYEARLGRTNAFYRRFSAAICAGLVTAVLWCASHWDRWCLAPLVPSGHLRLALYLYGFVATLWSGELAGAASSVWSWVREHVELAGRLNFPNSALMNRDIATLQFTKELECLSAQFDQRIDKLATLYTRTAAQRGNSSSKSCVIM